MVVTEPKLDPKGIYTLKQIREAMGISYSTMHRWIGSGLLKVFHHPGFGKPLIRGCDAISCWQGNFA